jgi:hypothetical protein
MASSTNLPGLFLVLNEDVKLARAGGAFARRDASLVFSPVQHRATRNPAHSIEVSGCGLRTDAESSTDNRPVCPQ